MKIKSVFEHAGKSYKVIIARGGLNRYQVYELLADGTRADKSFDGTMFTRGANHQEAFQNFLTEYKL